MTLNIKGTKLNIIRFDLTSPVLYFGLEFSNSLRIEQEFTLIKDNRKTRISREIKPDGVHVDFHGADDLLDLLGSTVKEAVANEDGSLIIDFDDDHRIEVNPDPDYEAWTLATPKGILVSLPGGGLG